MWNNINHSHALERVVMVAAESSAVSQKVPELIHIKTLEQIKQEKAVRSQPENQKSTRATEATESKASSGTKRAIAMNNASICNVKTFSEILHDKKKRQEEELEQKPRPEVNHTAERDQGKSQEEAHTAGPEVTNVGRIRVKTLEEIRMEKAARSQLKQAVDAENRKTSYAEESGAKKPRLLHIKKLAPQSKAAFLHITSVLLQEVHAHLLHCFNVFLMAFGFDWSVTLGGTFI